jgi:Cupin superfamily protein
MTQLLDIDATELATHFADSAFGVHHHLADHPLLTVEAVAELAEQLPERNVEHNQGASAGTVVGTAGVASLDEKPGEIARGIETNGCWMVLKKIELVPAYDELLNETLNEVEPLVQGREGGMNLREGFIFLSAPNSTTPAHTDHEHNFLLQIRGSKEMNVGRWRDSAEEQEQVERMFSGNRNMDRLPFDPTAYDLHPGDGVYVPPNAPHWVINGPGVSVSLSITFRTPVTQRGAVVNSINHQLRKLHITPTPPGEHLATDKAKFAAYQALRRLKPSGSAAKS